MNFERPIYSEKVTVSCGVGWFGIIGPYFFEKDRANAANLHLDRYVEILRDIFVPNIHQLGINRMTLCVVLTGWSNVSHIRTGSDGVM